MIALVGALLGLVWLGNEGGECKPATIGGVMLLAGADSTPHIFQGLED